MGPYATLAELVPALAEIIERSALPRSEVHRRAIAHLKTIADAIAGISLDHWVDDFPVEGIRDGSTIAALLQGVHDLASVHLYTRFDPEEALRAHAAVGAKMLAAGLSPPHLEGITDDA